MLFGGVLLEPHNSIYFIYLFLLLGVAFLITAVKGCWILTFPSAVTFGIHDYCCERLLDPLISIM